MLNLWASLLPTNLRLIGPFHVQIVKTSRFGPLHHKHSSTKSLLWGFMPFTNGSACRARLGCWHRQHKKVDEEEKNWNLIDPKRKWHNLFGGWKTKVMALTPSDIDGLLLYQRGCSTYYLSSTKSVVRTKARKSLPHASDPVIGKCHGMQKVHQHFRVISGVLHWLILILLGLRHSFLRTWDRYEYITLLVGTSSSIPNE